MSQNFKHTIIVSLICLGMACNSGQIMASNQMYVSSLLDTVDNSRIKEVFKSDEMLELVLYTDLETLLWDIGTDPSYHTAILKYKDTIGEWKELNVEVKTRGHFRKSPDNCDFPPLKLKFPKQERENTLFEDLKSVKMVTHCQTEDVEYDQYLLQEYLIYRLYRLLTDLSFRVKLLEVTYIDTENQYDTIRKHAFFLESPEDLAERTDGNILDLDIVAPKNIDQNHLALVALFEYMILNTDWSVSIMHDIELLSLDYFEPPFPVPYDFDWSGLINIPYDVPYVDNGHERIPEQVYKGPCLKRREFKKVISLFKHKRDEALKLYIDFSYLDEEYKMQTIHELDKFFKSLNDKTLIRTKFIEQCTSY